jgi:hypothetical protein
MVKPFYYSVYPLHFGLTHFNINTLDFLKQAFYSRLIHTQTLMSHPTLHLSLLFLHNAIIIDIHSSYF